MSKTRRCYETHAGNCYCPEHQPASWVVRERGTGRVLFETFNPRLVARLNTAHYEAVPIMEYLGTLNLGIRHAVTDSKSKD